jgi:hypothetical protein
MKILLAHPDRVSRHMLEALLAGPGREVAAFEFIEDALAQSRSYDLAVLRLEGAWSDRRSVEDAVEGALAGCRVLWMEDETTLGELGAKLPEELLDLCLPAF